MLTNDQRYRIAKQYLSTPDNSVNNIAENTNISTAKVRYVLKNDFKDGFVTLHSSMNPVLSITNRTTNVKVKDLNTGIEYPSIKTSSVSLNLTFYEINKYLKNPTEKYNLIRL